MIHYALKCSELHRFESWFQSAAAFDTLLQSGHLACPVCGDARIDKAPMAPAVRPARDVAAQRTVPDAPPAGAAVTGRPGAKGPALTTPANDLEKALAAMRREIQDNCDYVGMNFVAEARAMFDGDMPSRPIYGEASAQDARSMIEDGVPVAPLPFMPNRKVN